MSDNDVTPSTPDAGHDTAADFEPITSRDALQKIIDSRIGRIKQQYADYDALKSKAAEFDKLQDQSKSELQKMAERIAATENELRAERQNAMKATVSAAKGVPASALIGDTIEELEAHADELLAWRGKQNARVAVGLKSGATSSDSRMDPKERAANAIRAFSKSP